MNFYKLIGKRGHYGAGRTIGVLIYIKADDLCGAVKKYNNLGGFHPTGLSVAENHESRVKRKVIRSGFLPDVIQLSDEDVKELKLEEKINKWGVWVTDED